jgi:Icc-related predicted phosphoesterase
MVRIAAVGDLHVRPGAAARLRPLYRQVGEVADLLLLAGDLTQDGGTESAAEVCQVFGGLDLPVVAVLGNHDYAHGQEAVFAEMLADVGVTVLEGTATVVDTADGQVGIAGAKGFGGGFAGCTVTEFAEAEMKAFARRSTMAADSLRDALGQLDVDLRVALTHYAPTRDTLVGERLELYPFLGSHLLGAAIDGEPAAAPGTPAFDPEPAGVDPAAAPADESRTPVREQQHRVTLAVHGHAHYGTEVGVTPAGTQVRNVAAPVIHAPFAVYELPDATRVA